MERQPLRRRRPALSCVECRRRKIKCDRSDPCAHCVSTGSHCTYKVFSQGTVGRQRLRRSSRARTASPSENASSPSAERQRTSASRRLVAATEDGEGENSLGTRGGDAAGRDMNATDVAAGDDILPSGHEHGPDLSLGNSPQRVQKPQRPLALECGPGLHGIAEAGRSIATQQPGTRNSQVLLNKTRTLRWSHWIGMAPEFAPIVACYKAATDQDNEHTFEEAETGALVAEMGSLLRKCKEMARRGKLGRPERSLSQPGFDLNLPSRDVADAMTALYFQSFESTHRILHTPTFWADYERYWSNTGGIKTETRFRILLVIAIGSSLSDPEDAAHAGLRGMARRWVYAAQMWLSGPLEKDRLGVTGLQIHCLVILARQVLSIGADLVWMSTGSLVNRAMQIGLHRDPKHLPPMPVLQAELRRRLWATVLDMVLQSSLDSAMPPRMSLGEFDTEAPSNVNDDEMDESTAEITPHQRGVFTSTSMQLLLLESLPTRLRILQLLHSLHAEPAYPDVLALGSEMAEAHHKCVRFAKDNEKSGVALFHRNLLEYLVRRFLIPLHCHFANQARENPSFHYSLKVSLDTALALAYPEPDDRFARLRAVGGGLFREGFWYALSVVAVELLALAEAQRLDGTLWRDAPRREVLKRAVRDVTDVSAERVRQGETNVKCHMFLRMVTARVEAVEAGEAGELRIARAGRDGLAFCYDLICARVGDGQLPSPSDTDQALASLDDGLPGYGLDLDFDLFVPDLGFS